MICHKFSGDLVAFLCVVCSAAIVSAQTLAFPGAQGFGANVTGGRGGSVYHVTTLADSGAGSFRDAVSHSGRIIVFDVGGYITLASAVSCSGNLTIAGQTAPGGGIGFKSGEISFSNRSNIICRYIRVRPGSETASTGDDAIAISNGRTMIFDHVSAEFGPWNNVDAVTTDWQNTPDTEITFQNCLNADPTGQQFGAHTESPSSTMSWFNTIFANSHNRNPLSKINDIFVNNVLYNCGAGYTTHTSTSFKHDIVNNYFISGPGTGGSSDFPFFQLDANQSLYYVGNLFDGDSDGTLNGAPNTPYWYSGTGTILTAPWSALTSALTNASATTAFRVCLSQSGALPRDQIDDLVVSQVKTLGNGTIGTGVGTAGPGSGFYTSQTSTGLGNNGYGTITGGTAAIDSDGDGMPDYWEAAMGLNPGGNDAMVINADGYANIEHYINWLGAPHATSVSNAPVDIDLWQYTSGFTNVSPAYSVSVISNGVVTLTGGHIAHFTPTTNFVGMSSFRFAVNGSDGTSYTNTVNVLSVAPTVAGRDLVWRGDGSANTWNTNVANWIDSSSGTATVFQTGDSVTFDDSGSNTPAINLGSSLTAAGIFVTAGQDYTFNGSGAIIGAASLHKTGPGNLFINTTNSYSGGTFISDGVLQVGDGVSANGGISGPITNNDTLVFANPGAMTCSSAITGSGTLTKNGAGTLSLTGAQTFTNLTTINAGTVEFSTPPGGDITNGGALTFKPASYLVFPGAISGTGALTVNGAGTIVLSGANSFAGGITNLNGNLILSNNAAAGTGAVYYTNGSVCVAGNTVITNDYYMIAGSATDLCMQGTNGTGIWAGNIFIPNSAAQWRPGADSGGTFVFTGTANIGAHNFIVPRGSVQFASNAVVSSTGTATSLGRDSSSNKRSANITIKDNATVTLGVCTMGGGKTGGSVTVTVQNNAVLSLGANSLDLNNVSGNAAAIGTLRLNGGTTIVGGFLKSQASNTNIINFNGGILKAGQANASFLTYGGTTLSSDLVQAGGAKIDDGGFAITISAPLVHDPALGSTPDGGLTKLGAGTLTLTGTETFTGNVTVSNGTLVLPATASINTSSNLFIGAGATLDVSAQSPLFSLGSGRTISGFGTVKGIFYVGSGAVLSPGSSNQTGTLTFSNNLRITTGPNTLNFKLGYPTNSDSVTTPTLESSIQSVLNVTSLTGFGSGTYPLITYGQFSGDKPTLGNMPAGYSYTLTNTGTVLNLIVVSTNTAPPVFGNAVVGGGGLIMSGSNGPALGNYYVLTATNVSLPASNWTRLFTNQFDANGNFNFTNPGSANPQGYFRLLLP